MCCLSTLTFPSTAARRSACRSRDSDHPLHDHPLLVHPREYGDVPPWYQREQDFAAILQLAKRVVPSQPSLLVQWLGGASDAYLRGLLDRPEAFQAEILQALRQTATPEVSFVAFRRTPASPNGLLVLRRASLRLTDAFCMLSPDESSNEAMIFQAGPLDEVSISSRLWPHLRRCGPLLEEFAECGCLPHGAERDRALEDALAAAARTPRQVLQLVHSGGSFLGLDSWFEANHSRGHDFHRVAAERVAEQLRPHAHAGDVLELRELLGVLDPQLTGPEEAEARRQPLFDAAVVSEAACAQRPCAQPPRFSDVVAPPALRRGWTGLSDHEPEMLVRCLERCDARTLRELKAVSARWGARARRVLASDGWRRAGLWSGPAWSDGALVDDLVEGIGRFRAGPPPRPRRGDRMLQARMDQGGWWWGPYESLMRLDVAVELPQHAGALLPLVAHENGAVRWMATRLLRRLELPTLAMHVSALLPLLQTAQDFHHGHGPLEDEVASWLAAAKLAVRTLEPPTLSQHVDALLPLLENRLGDVVEVASEALDRLEPQTISQHIDALLPRLAHTDRNVSRAAERMLVKLEPPALYQHVGALLALLRHTDSDVQYRALRVLKRLDAQTLGQHVDVLLPHLSHQDWDMRLVTVLALDKLAPPTLGTHLGALLPLLADANAEVHAVVSAMVVRLLNSVDPVVVQLLRSLDAPTLGLLLPLLAQIRVRALDVVVKLLDRLDASTLVRHLDVLIDVSAKLRAEVEKVVDSLDAPTLAPHIDELLPHLTHELSSVRWAAVVLLDRLPPPTLGTHLGALLPLLADANAQLRAEVSGMVVKVLDSVDPPTLVEHLDVLLSSTDVSVVEAAVRMLGSHAPPMVEKHVDALLPLLEHPAEGVREAAVQAIRRLDPATPDCNAIHLAIEGARELLTHANESVREAAVKVLTMLDPLTVSHHFDPSDCHFGLLPQLTHANEGVREAATKVLGMLDPPTVRQHAGELLKQLANAGDGVWDVVGVFCALEPQALVPHIRVLPPLLEHSDWQVREAAVQLLGMLTPQALVPHVGVLLPLLAGEDDDVRRAVVEVLVELDAGTLKQHVGDLQWLLGGARAAVRAAVVKVLGRLNS